MNDDLDLARGHVGVLGALGTAAHGAAKQHDPLGPHALGDHERRAGRIRVEGALDDAGAVAQVEEDEAAVVATLGDPAGERSRSRRLVGAQRAADVGGSSSVRRAWGASFTCERVECVVEHRSRVLASRSRTTARAPPGRPRSSFVPMSRRVTSPAASSSGPSDHHEARAEPVGLLELRLERTCLVVDLGGDTGVAQRRREREDLPRRHVVVTRAT